MKTYAMCRQLRVLLVLPFIAIAGCAATGFGYGVAVSEAGPYETDPYAAGLYGYGTGLDPYGYPYTDWYGGYGAVYPGYVAVAPVVVPYAGSSLGSAPESGAVIHPHPGPSPRHRSEPGT